MINLAAAAVLVRDLTEQRLEGANGTAPAERGRKAPPNGRAPVGRSRKARPTTRADSGRQAAPAASRMPRSA